METLAISATLFEHIERGDIVFVRDQASCAETCGIASYYNKAGGFWVLTLLGDRPPWLATPTADPLNFLRVEKYPKPDPRPLGKPLTVGEGQILLLFVGAACAIILALFGVLPSMVLAYLFRMIF